MSKTAMGIITFIIGGAIGSGITWAVKEREKSPVISQYEAESQSELDKRFNRFFDKNFFEETPDPFAYMNKVRNEMESLFGFGSEFDSWFTREFGGSLSDVEVEETPKSIKYVVELREFDKETLAVNISKDQVKISAYEKDVQRQEEEGELMESSMYKSFSRVLPTPTGVDTSKAAFKTKGNKVIIEFPKQKG